MIANKDNVLQAIRKLASDNGYGFFYKGSQYKRHRETLCLAVQPKEGDERPSLDFDVAEGSNRFRVTFAEINTPEYCKDLGQLLDTIKDWLLNREAK